MNKYVAIDNIQQEFLLKQLPSITLWNRLEARPRTTDFNRALKAEVRDALFMLTKQWQMGEFLGDDAGSPVFSKIHAGTTHFTKYVADEHSVQDFEDSVPLETRVEQRPFPFLIGQQKISLNIRLLMGRQWLKLVSPIGNFKNEYVEKYKITLPDPKEKTDAKVTAHSEVWQQFMAVSSRCMDGAELYFYLKSDATHHAYDDIATVPDGKKTDIDDAAVKFISWFEKLYYQSSEPEKNAWKSSFLEYQFTCSAPVNDGEKVLTADEYYHGHMDWYNLDIDPSRAALDDTETPPLENVQGAITESFIPVPVTFDGMPNTRWWAFEDSRTNFGDINPSTTDLGKLLFMEFGLVFANDWFLMPFTLDAGSIANIKGMSVTNVFGERFWIEAAGKGLDDDWQKWSMFTLNTKGNMGEQTDTSLLMLPTTQKILEGKPIEEIHFVRDEMANMVWGIERQVSLATGFSKTGSEAAFELRNRYQKILNDKITEGTIIPVIPEYKADIFYQVMNSVPENWIPFIPVHNEGDIRSIKLQRAAMPRILSNDDEKPQKIRPGTTLLREGLDLDECTPYFLNEEEVPRAGANVTLSYQRTRWYNGKVFTWLGIRKQTGRGEGSSGLAFDQVVAVKNRTKKPPVIE